MTKPSKAEVVYYVDIGIDHKLIADTIESAIFFAADENEYEDAEDFMEREQERQSEEYPDTIVHLKKISLLLSGDSDDSGEQWRAYYVGGVLAMSVLDKIAVARGVEPKDFRTFWLNMKEVGLRGIIDYIIDTDDVVIRNAAEDYVGVAIKVVDEFAQDQQGYDAFTEMFGVVMATGKQAMARLLLARANTAASKILETVDYEEFLGSITKKEVKDGYELDASFEYRWMQCMFENSIDQNVIDAQRAMKFTQAMTDLIATSETLMQVFSPPNGTKVRIQGVNSLLEYEQDDNNRENAEVLFIDSSDFIEGVFDTVASVVYHPKPSATIEDYDPSKDLVHGPAICLKDVSVIDSEGDRRSLTSNTVALIAFDHPNLVAHYRLPKS